MPLELKLESYKVEKSSAIREEQEKKQENGKIQLTLIDLWIFTREHGY